jgi:2-polyprenyl-3-methyl-5-hydroxy-6-metoxy-1,4-benzoquinol methylase
MKETLPPENIYGHTKKLRFVLGHLSNYMERSETPITVLDFGCGNGVAVSQFLIRKGVTFYGVDIHEPSIEYAKIHFGGENALFLHRLPDSVIFDVIVYADILEHLHDPEAVLRDHWTKLKDRGLIIGSVPNGYGPFEMEKRFARWFRLDELLAAAAAIKGKLCGDRVAQREAIPYNIESGHVQFFSRRVLYSLFHDTGFSVEDFRNGSFVGAPFSQQLFLRGQRIAEINATLADFLPHWMVSTWYFTARKTK